jgi:hypothetical protein
MTTNLTQSRRELLKSGGALIVSFSLPGQTGEALAQAAPAKKPVALTEVDSFLAIDSKGAVTVYSGKVDLGTGVETALAQMVAEELDVPLRAVKIVQGDTALTPDQGPTFGSLSIQIGGVQIRNAAAMAKSALVELAAKRLGVKPEDLKVAEGIASSGTKHVSYGDLIGGKTFSLSVDHQKPPATKDPRDYKIVGKTVSRLDIGDKMTGKFTYMHGRAAAQGNVVEMGGAARAGQAVRARSIFQGRQGRGDRQCRRYARGDAQRRHQETQRHLRFRHSYPRVDRPLLRGSRIQGRQIDLVVRIAGDSYAAKAIGEDVRTAG